MEAPTSVPTETSLESEDRRAAPSLPGGPESRFLPGTVLAQRYRIVALLGKGGMGEVYRADDLKLGQPVALKFLPKAVERDERRLNRLLSEVKVALKVTHPNVCRVYDVGEVDGQHYISMEYVDGEDLASLLRRIGRLPEDRAVRVARQLCSGLAAAHEEGILHRDLKPANVMIDGRGRAKITDFGLASLAEKVEGDEVRAGTPGYMAPEQVAGKEVTLRSDLYSLGLVLYELFTGRRAFEASTLAEMERLQRDSTPTSPTSHVEGLGDAVERVILRCLENDPTERPPSALAVAAALPGGDPLAAALAAGETPSPELVAAAGERGVLSPVVAWGGFAAFVVCLVLVVLGSAQTQLSQLVPLEKSPDVLVNEARELLNRLGHDDPPADSTWEFDRSKLALDYLLEEREPSEHFELLRAGWPAINFWYRQSPDFLVPYQASRRDRSPRDPPHVRPGMAKVYLGSEGRLFFLSVVPPLHEVEAGPSAEPDWGPLLDAAGLDREALEPVEPAWTPDVSTDVRVAWRGTLSDGLDLPVQVEAGGFHGRPVYFWVVAPWYEPPDEKRPRRNIWESITRYAVFWTFMPLLVLVAFLARRNARLGRSDRKAATRIALTLIGASFLAWMVTAHHVPSFAEANLVFSSLGVSLFGAAMAWALYVSLEPHYRRLWPRQLVSWIRLIDGRFRNPLVGRDLLVGALGGVGIGLLQILYFLLPRWAGSTLPAMATGLRLPTNPAERLPIALGGTRYAAGEILGLAASAVIVGLAWVMLLTLLALVLRKKWLAAAGWSVLFVVFVLSAYGFWLSLLCNVVVALILLATLLRFGLLSVTVSVFVSSLLAVIPMTFELSRWYSGGTIIGFLVLLALTAYGAWTSSAGQPLLRD
jgi:serine/threonine-protein kinase